MAYDAFISYSHAADGLLAPRLQAGLQRFAKPWWKRRAIRIFRDEASLSANPHLWSSITEALDESEWFVLLLSPETATSPWVNDEVTYWLANKPDDRILPVVTEGEFGPDIFPPALTFDDEPRWVDLRFARTETQLDLKNPRFSAAVADIASPVRGIPKDDLESEEVRQHRRTIRTAWAGSILVVVLAVVASVFAVRAGNLADEEAAARLDAQAARDDAQRREVVATARELAANATINLDTDPELSILLALEGAGLVDELPRELSEVLHRSVLTSRVISRTGRVGVTEYARDGALGTLVGEQVAAAADRLVYADGTELVMTSIGTREELWRIDTGGRVDLAALSADGAYVTTVSVADGYAFGEPVEYVLRNGATGQPLHAFTHINEEQVFIVIGLVEYLLDRGVVVVGGGFRGTATFDVETFERVDHGFSIDPSWGAFSVAAHEGLYALGTVFQDIRLFDFESGDAVGRLAQDGRESSLAIGEGTIFTGDGAGVVRAWNAETGDLLHVIGHHAEPVEGLRVNDDGTVTSWTSTTVKTWDVSEAGRGELATYDAGVSDDTFLATDDDGQFVLTIPYNNTAVEDSTRLYERSTGQVVASDPVSIGLGGALSPDGSKFATQRNNRIDPTYAEVAKIVVVDIATGFVVELDDSDRTGFQAIAFSSDGLLIVAGDTNGLTSIWRTSDGAKLIDLEGGQQFVTDALFLHGDEKVATAHGEGVIRIWNATTGEMLATFEHSDAFLEELALHPSLPLLASGSQDGLVKVWDLETFSPEPVAVLDRHTGSIPGLDFSPDGSRLATASVDGTVRVWDVERWSESLSIGLPGPGESIVFLPDDSIVVSIDGGAVIELTLDTEELLEIARGRVTRRLTNQECEIYLHVEECER